MRQTRHVRCCRCGKREVLAKDWGRLTPQFKARYCCADCATPSIVQQATNQELSGIAVRVGDA